VVRQAKGELHAGICGGGHPVIGTSTRQQFHRFIRHADEFDPVPPSSLRTTVQTAEAPLTIDSHHASDA